MQDEMHDSQIQGGRFFKGLPHQESWRLGKRCRGKVKIFPSRVVHETKKVVRYTLHLDQNKMNDRKCLSEHPFGTIKRTIGESFFLLKNMLKTEGEMALYCLAYNIRRVLSLQRIGKMTPTMEI